MYRTGEVDNTIEENITYFVITLNHNRYQFCQN